ncbi:MAG: FABP family protein, partial [Propionibacteriaceae bacterium]|nr:FABP family protein [Propionibacteriaceae bacterium]
ARTVTADVEVTGGHRLYGLVESDLMFAIDRGTTETELQPYIWARLKRV